jgi:AcrR family transcriptional regulator
MSPRPRKASDEEIFAAAHRIMMRLGPAQWTLADIAAEAGLTAGALVQRFGSKRGLMVTLTEQVAAATPGMFARLRAAHPSPLAALRAYAGWFARMGEGPGGVAHHLAYLTLDLSDPDLHRHVRAQARGTRAALRDTIADAVAAGELPSGIDPDALARAVEVTVSGSLMAWAVHQEGPAADWLRHDFDAVIGAFSAAAAGAGEHLSTVEDPSPGGDSPG